MSTTDKKFTLADIRPGADTAVRICMNVQEGERVFILSDQPTRLVGRALRDASEDAGATVALHELEEYAVRPILRVPVALVEAIEEFQPDVSFYAASGQPGEVGFRMELRPQLLQSNPAGVRHGHMIGITPQLMTQGMQVDYQRVHDVTLRVHQRAVQAQAIRVTNPKGTDLTATFSPDLNWIPCHGLYHEPGMWGNLPEGETFTAPLSCEGVLVADELGDYFSEKYGVLADPVTFVLEDGRVTQIECADESLQAEVEAYIFGAENADRAGEFAIGTNIALIELVGNLLQDEKFPGVHVAFGNPYPSETGADWTSTRHMDVIPTQCNIDVDGELIMTNGVFAPEILDA